MDNRFVGYPTKLVDNTIASLIVLPTRKPCGRLILYFSCSSAVTCRNFLALTWAEGLLLKFEATPAYLSRKN